MDNLQREGRRPPEVFEILRKGVRGNRNRTGTSRTGLSVSLLEEKYRSLYFKKRRREDRRGWLKSSDCTKLQSTSAWGCWSIIVGKNIKGAAIPGKQNEGVGC